MPVPVMFGGFGNQVFTDPPSTEQLIAVGWGYATISPNSIQADNGAGLTKGIIGLCNLGRPARALDYLETDPTANAKQVGIEARIALRQSGVGDAGV